MFGITTSCQVSTITSTCTHPCTGSPWPGPPTRPQPHGSTQKQGTSQLPSNPPIVSVSLTSPCMSVQELNVAGYSYKALGYVAAGPLRSTVMGSYAADGDHPKRMVSVEANSKFADPQTGPDEPWQVQGFRV